ncbi:MAG: STT3 domain-containing protein [Bryobacteraceae bacterium]
MRFFGKQPWIAVGILSLISFSLRTIPKLDSVFQGDFVNFQETDAWFHVRIVENLVRHFPHLMSIDPYSGIGPAEGLATGPFYDWLLGGIAWLAGAGHPSEGLLLGIAAWYPAVLGALIVPVVFLLGRKIFGVLAGLCAASVIATLPGHFLMVSSLGFTDHHVMESLLSALFLLALLDALEKPESNVRAALAGLALSAYLLTFVGGAFFVAIVVAWAAYDRIRCLWPREEPSFPGRPFMASFALAAAMVAPFYKQLWMPYSIAALLLGATAVFLLDRSIGWCRGLARPRAVFFSGAALAAAGAFGAAILLPNVWKAVRSVVPFFLPAYFGTTGAVRELQALVLSPQGFTLTPAWRQFAGAYILSIVALVVLGELAVKRPRRGATLLFFWGGATFLLAMGQVRMTYYFAVAAALLSGYLVARVFEEDARRWVRWAAAAVFAAGVFVPNIARAVEAGRLELGVPEDWRQALEWIKRSTPEPFGDPSFYYANYPADFTDPPEVYSVMNWWDYGYWLEAIARRVPVSNPTQHNAGLAARFYLAESEDEAIQILSEAKSRYVVVNSELPLLMDSAGVTSGLYSSLLVWDKSKNEKDYFLVAQEPAKSGKFRTRLLYLPAYYRSMAARLFVYGTEGIADPQGAVVAYFSQERSPSGQSYRVLRDLRRFDSAKEAAMEERSCRAQGCVLAGENPQISCVPLAALTRLSLVFGSEFGVLGAGRSQRSAVQVYQIR